MLRTFSKAYGLAGLRVGFAVAHPPVAQALRQTAVPFGVSTVAQPAALASLAAEDALLERVDALVAERERVEAGLRAQGWPLPASQANFVWLRLGEPHPGVRRRVRRPASACGRTATRACASRGEPEANDRFLAVAAAFGASPGEPA